MIYDIEHKQSLSWRALVLKLLVLLRLLLLWLLIQIVLLLWTVLKTSTWGNILLESLAWRRHILLVVLESTWASQVCICFYMRIYLSRLSKLHWWTNLGPSWLSHTHRETPSTRNIIWTRILIISHWISSYTNWITTRTYGIVIAAG